MSDYYLLITDAGKALEVATHASGEPVSLTDFAVGDGGGSPVTPDATQTALTNETFRDVLSSLNVSVTDASVLEAECIIPASSGGYTIREIGIFASDGTLYAVGNFAEQEKPAPDSGYAASLKILADLVVSDTRDITLTVQDGSYLTETQADTIYLRQDKRLGEIAAQGADAQTETRENIGCGTAAAADTTESKMDTTSGRLLKVGDFGLGEATGMPLLHSIFDITCTAFYSALGTAHADGPTEGMPASSADTRFGVYAESIYTNQFWVVLSSTSQTYTGLVDTSKKTTSWIQHYTEAHKPTASDVGALPLIGGTLTSNAGMLRLKNTTQDESNYMLAQNADGTNRWYIGNGSANNDDVVINNYSTGAHIVLSADGTIIFAVGDYHQVCKPDGTFNPYSYANFDTRYQAKGSYYTTSQSDSRYIQAMRQGTQGGVTVQSDTDSLTPTGSYAMGWHAEGDNPGGDTLIYRYLQAKVNGSWATIGYNTASPNPTLRAKKLPRSRLSQLTNLQMYRPDEDWSEYLMNFIDESGYPWHLVAPELEGSVFIAYDGEGVIQQIDTDATMLTPLNLSVAGLDSVPDGCRINSSWKFDGTNIYQDVDMASAAILSANTAKRNSLANKTTTAITMFNASAAVGNPRDGDADNLLNARSYLDALRDVDLTLESPTWPTVPTFIL